MNRRCEIRDGGPESPVPKIQLRLVSGPPQVEPSRLGRQRRQERLRETGRPYAVQSAVFMELEVTVGDHEEETTKAVEREPRFDLALDPSRGGRFR